MARQHLEIIRLTENLNDEWNQFIARSKNGTFLFHTDYMHYHRERFQDYSLLVKENRKVVAVLPGNRAGDILYSHQGLTYGGLVTLPETKAAEVMDYFNGINRYLLENGVERVVYKKIPAIYAKFPAEEDEYCLFRLGASWVGGAISSAIDLTRRLPYSKLRMRLIKKAAAHRLEIRINEGNAPFWGILTDNLRNRYNTAPIHTLQEMQFLHSKFPDNIKLYTIYRQDECLGGAVMYETDEVAHVQYIAASEAGKNLGALDFLFHQLITDRYRHKRYFDFGASTEENGHYLNEGLIAQKQGFGARAAIYRTYEYTTKSVIVNREKTYG